MNYDMTKTAQALAVLEKVAGEHALLAINPMLPTAPVELARHQARILLAREILAIFKPAPSK